MPLILLIDDNPAVRNTLQDLLRHEGYHVDLADSCRNTPRSKQEYDLIIAGRHCMPHPLPDQLPAPVIVMAREPSIEDAVEVLQEGAVGYFYKPFDQQRFLETVRKALSASCERREAASHAHHAHVRRKRTPEPIVGESELTRMLRTMIDKVAGFDSRILVEGANGTGKEMVARWLHHKSKRNAGPLVEVNCAAIPSELIESELFGHEKGSFTSADRMRRGKFEQAQGGTIFLDEIGDMSLAAQAKVLRALQERKISRVGSDRDIPIDVRVIAATNKNLQEEIAQGRFREDLYHRLAVIVIRVPTLAERIDDLPLLVEHFIAQAAQELDMPAKEIDREAIEALARQPWRGNIRELGNAIERLLLLSRERITAQDVTLYVEAVRLG